MLERGEIHFGADDVYITQLENRSLEILDR
jgi:hypothetical protein